MSEQARGILQAVGRRLDDTRDLLDAAMEQATALERSLRDHEDTVNDLRWDAAKILLDPNSSRSTLRAVQAERNSSPSSCGTPPTPPPRSTTSWRPPDSTCGTPTG